MCVDLSLVACEACEAKHAHTSGGSLSRKDRPTCYHHSDAISHSPKVRVGLFFLWLHYV